MPVSRGPLYHLQGQEYDCNNCGKTFIINAGSHGCCSNACANAYKKLKRWTPEQLRDIAYRYEWETQSVIEIGAAYSIEPRTIASLLDYCGIKRRPSGSAYWSVQKRRAFSRRAAEGLEGKEVQTSLFDENFTA